MVQQIYLDFRLSVKHGAARGWRGFIWMLKIIIPVSLATFLIDYAGWISCVDEWLEPMMGAIHLPAMAALPLLAGLLTGIYGAIAAMSVLPLSVEQMTLMAVFLLIAHSLIQEGLIQHQSGCPAWMATAVRLAAAIVTVYALGWMLGPETAQKTFHMSSTATPVAFWPAMLAWAVDMGWLSLKIFLIIMGVMIFMAYLKQSRLIEKVVRVIEPLLSVMGLDRQVGMLWLTAAVFGITYGGAVIASETRERRLHPDQLKPLHISIGINHAMIEDPVVFLPLGIHPLWLWIPRLVVAVVFTHTYRFGLWVSKRLRTVVADTAAVDGR